VTKICSNCKSVNADDATFCQNCGKSINQTSKATQSSNNPKSGGGISDRWNKQSKRNQAAIGIAGVCCIGLIIIIAVGGMLSPNQTANTANTNSTTTPTPTTTSNSTSSSTNTASNLGDQIQVVYDGSWTGDIDQDSSSHSVDGSGTETLNLTGNPSIVSVDFQKSDDGSGTLTVNILQNGNVVDTESTSAQYGVVSTAYTF